MATHWMVKHKATGQYQTQPRPNEKIAWEDFWARMERLPHGNKVLEKDYIAVEVQITETGCTCNNNAW